MGLDMYLKKKKKSCKKTIDEILNEDYEDYKKNLKEIVYWRKANAIHRYFVDTVQNGNDDCNFYLVSKEVLEDLLEKCNKIFKETNLVEKEVLLQDYYENGEHIKKYGPGKVIDNPEICEQELPTQDGFFFGSTDYDEYYLEDIKYTRDKIQCVLDMIDFDDTELYYGSSW